jgi:hypothetical protein
VLEAVCVRVAVTVRVELDEPVDVLLLVEVFVLVPEAVELLEPVDVLEVVVVLVDVKLAREVLVEVLEGGVEEVGLAERVDVRVELEDLVGNAPATAKPLTSGTQDGCGCKASIAVNLRRWSGGGSNPLANASETNKKARNLILCLYYIL